MRRYPRIVSTRRSGSSTGGHRTRRRGRRAALLLSRHEVRLLDGFCGQAALVLEHLAVASAATSRTGPAPRRADAPRGGGPRPHGAGALELGDLRAAPPQHQDRRARRLVGLRQARPATRPREQPAGASPCLPTSTERVRNRGGKKERGAKGEGLAGRAYLLAPATDMPGRS